MSSISAAEKLGKLTDDELDEARGKRDRLAGKLQEKYGIHKERAKERLDELINSI